MIDLSNGIVAALVGAAAGLAAGVGYFGLLWVTVRALPRLRAPALWLAASVVLRILLVLLLLVAIAAGRLPSVLGFVVAFLVVRTVAIRIVRTPPRGGG